MHVTTFGQGSTIANIPTRTPHEAPGVNADFFASGFIDLWVEGRLVHTVHDGRWDEDVASSALVQGF